MERNWRGCGKITCQSLLHVLEGWLGYPLRKYVEFGQNKKPKSKVTLKAKDFERVGEFNT